MAIIYGVDTEKPIEPKAVRDAMVECFYLAHCSETGFENDEQGNRLYCREIVKKAFSNVNAEYENPTKESLQKVIVNLQDYAKNFRDPEIIKKHAQQINDLIELI